MEKLTLRRRTVEGLCFAALAGLLVACRHPASPELLDQARALGTENRWMEATPLIKRYLCDHPKDPVGHLLFGQSLLHRAEVQLVPARGEFETALHYFEESESTGVIDGTMKRDEFLGTAYREIALAYLRLVRESEQIGAPPQASQFHLSEALKYVRRGLEALPDDAFLKEMEETIESYFPPSPAETAPGSPSRVPPHGIRAAPETRFPKLQPKPAKEWTA